MRPIHEIAGEISREWTNPYFGAVPYIKAMWSLSTTADAYYEDSGQSVVLYFLSNATTWRGPVAKRCKAELKQHCGLKLTKAEREALAPVEAAPAPVTVSYAGEVIADSSGKWAGNALRFATEAEALEYVRDLQWRWTSVRETRVVQSDEPVNYRWTPGGAQRLEEAERV